MKKLCLLSLGLLTASLFSACAYGDCPCNSYNKDYLRDVPVTTHHSFR